MGLFASDFRLPLQSLQRSLTWRLPVQNQVAVECSIRKEGDESL